MVSELLGARLRLGPLQTMGGGGGVRNSNRGSSSAQLINHMAGWWVGPWVTRK